MESNNLPTESIMASLTDVSEVVEGLQQLSRINSGSPFKVIDKEKFAFILEASKEVNEKIYIFSKRNSAVQRKLMTLTMLFPADATYRILHQIFAQIEKKQAAIHESVGNLKKRYAHLQWLSDKLSLDLNETERINIQVDFNTAQAQIANAFSYLEAAIKEIGYLEEAYIEIKKNKGISDDWDERDFEKSEIYANVENAFRNAVRDILAHGRIGMGTLEYMEQFGVSPFEAIKDVSDFVTKSNNSMRQGGVPPDYDDFYFFLNQMADKYKNCYKKAARRIGISDELVSKQFVLSKAKELTDGDNNS